MGTASSSDRRSQPSSQAPSHPATRRFFPATGALLVVGGAGAFAFLFRSTVLSHAAVTEGEWDRATEVLAVAELGAHACRAGWTSPACS